MRRFFSLAFALLSLGTSLVAQDKQHSPVIRRPSTLPEAINQIRNCVVRIDAIFLSPPMTSSGTGFFINRDGIVITAKHVIHPLTFACVPATT